MTAAGEPGGVVFVIWPGRGEGPDPFEGAWYREPTPADEARVVEILRTELRRLRREEK